MDARGGRNRVRLAGETVGGYRERYWMSSETYMRKRLLAKQAGLVGETMVSSDRCKMKKKMIRSAGERYHGGYR